MRIKSMQTILVRGSFILWNHEPYQFFPWIEPYQIKL